MSAMGVDLQQAFLDAVLADAEGERKDTQHLEADPDAWRNAIVDVLDLTRSDLASVNADISATPPANRGGFQRRSDLLAERAVFVERQSMLETRLRYVKPLCGPRVVRVDKGTAIEEARQHLFAALDILAAIERGDAP